MIAYNTTQVLKFRDGTPMQTVEEATYLGCDLNKETDMAQEINKRIVKCNTILNKMHIFWCNSKFEKTFKKLSKQELTSIKQKHIKLNAKESRLLDIPPGQARSTRSPSKTT